MYTSRLLSLYTDEFVMYTSRLLSLYTDEFVILVDY